jgi:hypothetical protein
MSVTKCKEKMEARSYLDISNWDVSAAVMAYKQDLQWEEAKAMELDQPSHDRTCC